MVARSANSKSRKPSKRPWLHGPVAWEVGQRGDAILATLAASPKRFLSQRQTACLLGISTQPVRDWVQAGLLEASGPRKQIPANAVEALVKSFRKCARPYEMKQRLSRLRKPDAFPSQRFGKLFRAVIKWPSKRSSLRPVELAVLVGCHSSMIRQAIHSRILLATRSSPHRWKIRHDDWIRSGYLWPRQANGKMFKK